MLLRIGDRQPLSTMLDQAMAALRETTGMKVLFPPLAALIALLGGSVVQAAERDYLTIVKTIEIAKPADVVWKRVGDYCEVGELLAFTCKIESGDGGVGTIRRLNGTMIESLVARTPYSYTYSQLEGPRAGTDYHGTMAVEPLSKSRSRMVYTVVIDRGRLPAGTDLADYQKQLEDRFQGVVVKAKGLIEAQK
jgi:Polyketide cyclase / dehydrase and lipid transport